MECKLGDIARNQGVTIADVKKWISDGLLDATQKGRTCVVDSEDFLRFVRARPKCTKCGYKPLGKGHPASVGHGDDVLSADGYCVTCWVSIYGK